MTTPKRQWVFDATAAGGGVLFYPEHRRWIATGGAGDLTVGGWTPDTWANVLAKWVAKSDGTWEADTVGPLGGNVPDSPVLSTSHGSDRGTWTNTTSIYKVFVEVYVKVSGVWTFDRSSTNGSVGQTQEDSAHSSTVGSTYQMRCRYTDGTTDGDWSVWSPQVIIPS